VAGPPDDGIVRGEMADAIPHGSRDDDLRPMKLDDESGREHGDGAAFPGVEFFRSSPGDARLGEGFPCEENQAQDGEIAVLNDLCVLHERSPVCELVVVFR
jgi:hypothetical protein